MGRNRVKLDEWETWVVPEDRGLYQTQPDQALTMEIRHLSKRDVKKLSSLHDQASKHPSKKQHVEDALLGWFSENIRNVQNYVIDDEPIVDGADLFNRGEYDIKQDATLALMLRGSLDEGLAKKLRPPSDLLSVPRQSNAGGGAQSAMTQSQPGSETLPTAIQNSPLMMEKSSDSGTAAGTGPVKPISSGPPSSPSAPIAT